MADVEDLLNTEPLRQIYEKCIDVSQKGFIKWYKKASDIYTKDEIQQKFDKLCQSFENIEKKTAKLLNLVEEMITISNELHITLSDIDFNDLNVLEHILEKNLEKLKGFQKINNLSPSVTQFQLKSPTTHTRISQSYEEFKAALSERKNKRSTQLFWIENGIPEIVTDKINSNKSSKEESTL